MPDYAAASKRHFRDAQYLRDADCLANADHLYGFAAECALKVVMSGLGMPMKGNRPEKPFDCHINKLWAQFRTFADGHEGSKYASMITSENPFSKWKVDDRYESGISIRISDVEEHQSGASAAIACLDEAKLDGVLA